MKELSEGIPGAIDTPSTNIRVDTSTRDRIDKLGKRGETFNAILLRLVKFYEEHAEKKEE